MGVLEDWSFFCCGGAAFKDGKDVIVRWAGVAAFLVSKR